VTGKRPAALAIVAHPDDIEFVMAGTLLLLKERGVDIHFWNLANGCYGSRVHSKEETARIRWDEAQAGARLAGATIHEPLVDDLGIFYSAEMIAKVASVVRAVKPEIVLTHSLQDYMEDHMIAARLAVTAAFIRGGPNYVTDPPVAHWEGDTVVYHSVPHTERGPMRELVHPELYVDISTTVKRKGEMLACHASQEAWLDATQGMSSLVGDMEKYGRALGRRSGRFEMAEGFRRHLHAGFAPEAYDPLRDILGDKAWADPAYRDVIG
jgi:LmbE family N-acetylglucosaminyl deacetylase